MSEVETCQECAQAANPAFYCDEDGGPWCGLCFDKTPCGLGVHGEGCPTTVFTDGE